ncbi:immunity 53 family protein [Bacillus sp. 2205SS5-2]|uniref:immunity 53 family protein n=1 Tax=Bacillus sp. 2205SS5-2 TaxID=3109031 RepID=UPI0030062992
MDTLSKIQNWFTKQCNGDWEHGYGINISTLDNPGWAVKINLIQTNLEEIEISTVDIKRNENDWIYCEVKNEMFFGYGGSGNLTEILEVFLKISEDNN